MADEIILTDYLHEVEHAAARIARLEQAIEDMVAQAPAEQQEVIAALAALRGIGRLTAITVVAEVGSFSRFGKARELMSYCGLVPSEHSSGGPGKAKRGGITKAGNAHLRRVLGEASWHYGKRPRITAKLARRQAGVTPEIQEISWKAQHRLHKRFVRLQAQGKAKTKAVIAVARELLGFLWDIGVRVERQHHAAAPRRQAA